MKKPTTKPHQSSETIYTFSSEWIHALESEEHWRLYWQQQRLMEGKVEAGQHVLEIGVGSGFAANYLRSKGVEVTTIDIDADKRPDIVANIVHYEWGNARFDHILAFEVFEHIPFVEFTEVLAQLSSVCKNWLFLSLPKCERVWLDLEFRLPLVGRRKLTLVGRRRRIHEPHHFWEVGSPGTALREVQRTLLQNGFQLRDKVEKLSRVFMTLESGKP